VSVSPHCSFPPGPPNPPGPSASFPTGCTFGSIAPSGWCLSSRRLPSNSLGSTPGTTGSSLPVSCSRRQSLTRLRSQSRRVRDWTCAQRVEGGDGVVEGRDWRYFNFNHHEPKAPTAKVTECGHACHLGGAKKDEVWTQFYPLLDK